MLKRDDDEFTIFNEKVPVLYTHVLYSMALTLIGVALIQFWDDFLIEESHTCSTNPDMDTPRLNCSNTDFTSVICYRFVFRIGSAAASVLGVVTVTGLTMNFINFVFVKISKIKIVRKLSLRCLYIYTIVCGRPHTRRRWYISHIPHHGAHLS